VYLSELTSEPDEPPPPHGLAVQPVLVAVVQESTPHELAVQLVHVAAEQESLPHELVVVGLVDYWEVLEDC
jgi:hypothetical protein